MASGRPQFSQETGKIEKLNKHQVEKVKDMVASKKSTTEIKAYLASKRVNVLAVTKNETSVQVHLAGSSLTFKSK
jgi:hypothetical protein